MDNPLFIVQCSVAFTLTCFENRLVGVVYTNNFVLLHWFYIGDWLDVHLDPPVTCPLVNYINSIVIDDWNLYFVANKNYLLTIYLKESIQLNCNIIVNLRLNSDCRVHSPDDGNNLSNVFICLLFSMSFDPYIQIQHNYTSLVLCTIETSCVYTLESNCCDAKAAIESGKSKSC